MTTSLATAPDAQLMRHCLEPMIATAFNAGPPIRAIHWGRFDLATSYDTHVATVQFTTGDTSKVFVKDFGFSVRRKDDAKQRREREVHVYQQLLADAGLGTPKCYGAIRNEERGRLWLLLEFVKGEPVG